MAYIPYTDSDEYQKEIAEQYKQRIGNFDPKDVIEALRKLGFNNVEADDLQTTTAGNMNATYLTQDLAIKINKQTNTPHFYANKVASDTLAGKSPVVEVLAYDYFDKTDFEILVMRKAPGQSLLDTIFDLPQEDVISIFKQVLNVIKELQKIKFDSFGSVNLQNKSYTKYEDFLKNDFVGHFVQIKKQKLFNANDIKKVEKYFFEHLGIFKDETPVFIHNDVQMGNIMHVGSKLTALIDFDWSIKAPKFRALRSLLAFVGDPQQFTEGSIYYEKYKNKNFMFLMPILKKELKELFEDKLLLRKLNMVSIDEGLKWIAEGWSEAWSKEMMKNLLENELPETEEQLKQTYYGKILGYEK